MKLSMHTWDVELTGTKRKSNVGRTLLWSRKVECV